MDLKFTPDELRKIIELAYLGEWMVNAHHDTDFQDDEAVKVLQSLLEQYPSENIERDAETKELYMRKEWVERIYDKYIFDYDDHVLWDELTERLAQRDLSKLRGVSLDDVNRDDDLLALRPFEEKYRRELEDNGIERLEISGDY